MTKIEEMLADLCPNGVEWKELGEVCEFKRWQSLSSKKAVVGDVPVISGGQKPAFMHNTPNREGETIVVAGSGAYAGFVSYWDKPIFVSDAFSVDIKNLHEVSVRYVFHFLLNIQQKIYATKSGAGIPHVYGKNIAKFLIPIPPLEIQQEIVKILDKFTEYVTELTAELTDRQKQYSFYRDKLLSFEDEVYQVEWKTLGEVALVTKLAGYEFTKYVQYSNKGNIIALRGLNIKKGKLILDDVKYIDNSDFSKLNRSKLQKDDLLFTYVGTVGEVALVDENNRYYLAPNVAMVRNHSKLLNPRYLMYYFQSCAFVFKQIDKYMESSSMKNLTMEKIRQFKIPVPSLEIQSRIVQVLDNFDAFCNDLNIGLPKEIELRQKQYEYFREKLLTFTAEGVYPGQWTVSGDRPT